MEGNSDFVSQLTNASLHSPTSWHREFEVSKALKMAQEDENYYDEAICLELLGDIYNERGKTQDYDGIFENLDDMILSTALYNSTLLRTESQEKKDELKSKLRETEEDFLKLCGVVIDKSTFEYDVDKIKRTEKLEEFRQSCRDKLKIIQTSYSVFLSPVQNRDIESERNRAEELRGIFIEIKKFMKTFIGELLDDCVHVLASAVSLEVDYAFIGFGSFARDEMTPFSDIECAILVDQETTPIKEYFIKLVEYFNFKILNLQETILPSMCIPCLNDKNKNAGILQLRHKCTSSSCTITADQVQTEAGSNTDCDWFYDRQMRGFSLDGRMKSACKTPLGKLVVRNGKDADADQLLIKTPNSMANIYYKSLEADINSNDVAENDENISTVFSNISFLYGNNEALVEEYYATVFSFTESSPLFPYTSHRFDLQTTMCTSDRLQNFPEVTTNVCCQGNIRQVSALISLHNAMDVFTFSFDGSDLGMISSLKQKLYRVVSLLVTNLGKYQFVTVIDNSPWSILGMFLQNGMISNDAYHNLKVIVGIVNESRLRSYLRRGRQDEVFSFYDQSIDIDFHLSKNLFVRFFYTMIPFQKAVRKFLLQLVNHRMLPDVHFNEEEKFYTYSHLISAIALSLTSANNLDETMNKFSEAFQESQNENNRRLCLAFLSCLHPDYSTRYCEKLLRISERNSQNSRWRILTLLVGSFSSFHQNNIQNVRTFLESAMMEISQSSLDSSSQVFIECYRLLLEGLLKYHGEFYTEAVHDFDEARTKYLDLHTQKSRREIDKANLSILVNTCVFMKGRCRMKLGHLNDSNVEMAMRTVRAYTANGDYMRILYHAYIGVVSLDTTANYGDIFPNHIEKILELYLRFKCPQGQDPWVTITLQGVILAALFLAVYYRQFNRVEDALRILQITDSQIIPKSLKFCEERYHVGTIEVTMVKTCVQALKSLVKLLEAECLHTLGRHDAMRNSLSEAISLLAKYHNEFPPIEIHDVISQATLHRTNQQRRREPGIWQTSLNSAPAPRLIDYYTMAYTLQSWCDSLTLALKYILYTLDQDLTSIIIQAIQPIVSMLSLLSNNPSLLNSQFQTNPYKAIEGFLPLLFSLDGNGQMMRTIFNSANQERSTMFNLMKKTVVECQYYAAEFTDQWIEVMLLSIRLSLCHDLIGASGILD